MPESGQREPTNASTRSPTFRAWLGPLIVFALSCLVFEASARIIKLPPAWRTFEFCQYAEIGRNLAEDGAYDTRVMEPMALAMIDRDMIGPTRAGFWPVVNRYPLPPFVIASLMRVFGTTDRVAAWSNGLAVGLLAVILYAASRSWFGAKWAALVAFFWLVNPSFYAEFILLGTPDVWFAALFLADILVWSRFDPVHAKLDPRRLHWRWALGLGVLGGLSYLARFNASLFLAIQAGILGIWWRRWREAGVMALTVLAVASPSLFDTWRHFGRPTVSLYSMWNLLDGIGAYRVEPWLYYRVPDVGREVLAHLPGVIRKVEANLRLLGGRNGVWIFWRLDVLIPLAIVGLWLGGKPGGPFRRATGSALGLFSLQLVLFSGLRLEVGPRDAAHNARYFFWFAPFAVVLGVATLRRLAMLGRGWGRVLVAGAVGFQLFVMGWGWVAIARFHLPGETNLGQDPVRLMLMEVVQPGQVIASTHPQITAWFCGLRSISLPADPDEVARLNGASPTPADYLLVDVNFNSIDLDPRWDQFVRGGGKGRSPWKTQILKDYRFVLPPDQTSPIGYVLLRRVGIAPSPLERRFSP